VALNNEPTSSVFDRARAAFGAGVQAFEAGHTEQAESQFLAALALLPGRPSTLHNLAAVRVRQKRPAEALALMDQALTTAPDDATGWYQRGQVLQALGRPVEALNSYDRVIGLRPEDGAAWSQRGGILKDMGQLTKAREAFQTALQHGAEPDLNRYFLASVEQALGVAASEAEAEVPPSAPPAYVAALFDSYADDFDNHLVQQLGYRTPALMAELLPPGRRFAAALDLGCGTGLMAPSAAPHCQVLDGVDLSAGMLERAHALGLYRELYHAEAVAHLQGTLRRYPLVLAADVLVYFGELTALFTGVARVLEPGGLFVFSVEESSAPGAARAAGRAPLGYELRASSRYAHSEAYLREQAAHHGFELAALHRGTLRQEQQAPIGGLLVSLVRKSPGVIRPPPGPPNQIDPKTISQGVFLNANSGGLIFET
jgi:predicted TPR repeat methyltransferase